ncbi:PAS domain S-box protein [Rhodovastum atsumiense]|uniref:PAS domain S-box protein n=1 Tax=Rhodovastum atsumiense TaxID=504468 RepID=UPI002024F0A1|nr:PAS domain S-box protein [Rhodovastum atsumiense]CAH2604106.1 PAS domain S-box protein [Rhodovastum atsumiense]
MRTVAVQTGPSPSLRARLSHLVLVASLPLILLAAGVVFADYRVERQLAAQQAQAMARGIALAVEGELHARIAALQVLASSHALITGDLPTFRAQAEAFLSREDPEGTILVLRKDGEQVMNTAAPPGTSLPRRQNLENQRRVLATGRPSVSDVFFGQTAQRLTVAIDVPVRQADGGAGLILAMAPSLHAFDAAIQRQHPPPGWLVSVADRKGVIVARTHRPEYFIGKSASPDFLALLFARDEDIAETTSLEGTKLLTTWSRPGPSGWSVIVGIPRAAFYGPLWRALGTILTFSALALAAAFVLARRAAARIAQPILALVDPGMVQNLAKGRSASLGLREADITAIALAAATDSLRDAEARLQFVMEAAEIGTWDLDLVAGTPSIRSLRHDQMFGYQELQPAWSQAIAEYHVLEADRPVFRSAFERARQTGLLSCEVRVRWPDGNVHWIAMLGRTDHDAAGWPVRMAGVVTDVTERKQSEEKLRLSELRYRMLHESLRDAFVQVAMDGRVVEFNDLYREMLGYTADELHTMTYQDLTPERWHSFEARIVQDQILLRGYSDIYEKEYRRKDGTVLPVELRTILVRDAGGEPDMMWAIVRDISERQRTAAALRDNEERFRLLVESWAQAVWETEADGMVTADSPSWRAYTGQSLAQWLGHGWVNAIHPEDRSCAERQWREAVAGRRHVDAEFRLRSVASNGWRWTNMRAVPVPDPAGIVRKWVGMNIDIHERKIAEAALRESETRLAADLAAMQTLQSVSTDLVGMREPEALYSRIVEAATVLMRSDAASIQELHAETNRLKLMACRGFHPESATHWEWVRADSDSACGRALRAGKRIIISDLEQFDAGSDDAAAFRSSGFLSVVSLPLRAHSGRIVGMLSAQWRECRTPTGDMLRFLDVLARLAANLIERLQILRRLRESEARFRQFGEASSDVLWIRNAKTLQWEYLSPAFEAIYGADRETVFADNGLRSWAALIVEEDRERAVACIARVCEGDHVTFEYRIRRPDGALRWLRNTDFPMRSASGAVERIGGIGQDVTELKRVEAALRDEEARQRALVEGIPQFVWRATDGGRWTWSSPQWSTFTGLSGAESHGHGWLGAVHPGDREPVMAAWAEADRVGGLETEHRLLDAAQGAWRWFQTRARPVRNAEGHIVEWLGTSTDVHDLRRMQEVQKVLVAEVQHRTRNLLAVIGGIADQTLVTSDSLDDFGMRFEQRLAALGRAQALLSREGSSGILVEELVRLELAAHGADAGSQARVGGPPVVLPGHTVQLLALALHELATNAIKHGALGHEGGRLDVAWTVQADPDAEGRCRLHLDWRESGLVLAAPSGAIRRGFGRELLEVSLPYDLDAETLLEFCSDGVRCRIELPLDQTAE